MKKALLFACLFVAFSFSYSQTAPPRINYQGMARTSSGGVLASTIIGVQFNIRSGSASGPVVFNEIHNNVNTNGFGLFSLQIGSVSSLSSVNWGTNTFYLEVLVDAGSGFNQAGTPQELISTPYALYAQQTPPPAVSFSNNVLSVNGSTAAITTGANYGAGTGINITGSVIANSAPDLPVGISSGNNTSVSGSYPSFTVDVTNSNLNYNASTNLLTLTQGTNTSSATIPVTPATPATSLTASGNNVTVTGTGPGFTIASTPSLVLSGAQLSITDGNTVTLPTGVTYTPGTAMSITSGSVINNTAPDQIVTIGNGTNVNVTGTYPSFIIDATPSLSISSNILSITGGNSVTLPSSPTYTAGSDISLTGNIISNTAPDQTVTITPGSNITVGGTYPNFNIASNPSLSISGNTVSITGGNSINLPTAPSYTSGTGISISSGSIINTAPDQAVSIVGTGGTNVTGTYPNFVVNSAAPVSPNITINSPHSTTTVSANNYSINIQPTNITGVGLVSVGGSYPNYNLNVPPPALTYNASNGVLQLTQGAATSSVVAAPTLSLDAANVLTSGPSTNSVAIPTYVAGTGLVLTGTSPNFTLGTTSTGTNTGWNTLGNAGTIDGTNFIGTTDNVALNIRVNNQKAGRIDHIITKGTTSYGYTALNALTTGVQNAAFGYEALKANTNGSYNTGIGISSLYTNTGGASNTGVGFYSLYFNTTGHQNTAVGVEALMSNTTGSNNVAVGYDALYTNEPGVHNTALGYFALANSYNGNDNTAVGADALWSNNAGSFNTAVGRYALRNSYNPSNNTAVGHYALGGVNNGPGNTAIGANAGYTTNAVTTGSFNTFIGYNTGLGSATQRNNATAIGYNAKVDASNALVLGGTGVDAVNVGIGVTAPSKALHVYKSGSGNTGTLLLESATVDAATNAGIIMKNGSSSVDIWNDAFNSILFQNVPTGYSTRWRINNSDKMTLDLQGKLGIGTTAPQELVQVESATGPTDISLIAPAGGANTQAGVAFGTPATHFLGAVRYNTNTNTMSFWTSNTPDRLFIGASGNVGIKTNNPLADLHVFNSGTSSSLKISYGASSGLVLYSNNTSAGILNYDNTNLYLGTNGANRVTILNSGNVGIATGVVTPGSLFSVFGGAAIGASYGSMAAPVGGLIVEGRGGFGTSVPNASAILHANGKVMITDGTQGTGKILTSDAAGLASWQSPVAPSRVRSVIVDPGMFDLTFTTAPPSKILLGGWQRPCINYPDGSLTQVACNLPIPADWNGTTNFTVEVLYSSPATTGNFFITISNSNVGLNMTTISGTGGTSYAISPSATVEGLMIQSHVIFTSTTDKMIQIYIRRDGANGSDTSTSPMRMYGIRLKYMD